MPAEPTITVLNTPCLLTTREALAERLGERCRQPRAAQPPLSVDFTNVHIVALRTTDEAFLQTTASVDWFVSDSQVLSWAIWLRGGRNHARVYGPDFLTYVFSSGPKGLSHYFLGGSAECLERLCRNLDALEPGFVLAGSHHGYFGADDEAGILEEINRLDPDVLWVGLGTPKQQEWIARNKPKLKAGAVLAVGFAFDVNAGTKKDAPAWLGPIGCTWLYRLLCEPRRLWRRYLVYNTVFLCRLMLQCVGRRA